METPEYYPEDAPDQLVVMSEVALGRAPATAMGKSLSEWLRTKPVAFQEKLAELNRAYWAGREGKVKWTGVGVCPTCGRESEGEGDAGGVLTEWLGVKHEGRVAE